MLILRYNLLTFLRQLTCQIRLTTLSKSIVGLNRLNTFEVRSNRTIDMRHAPMLTRLPLVRLVFQ